MFYEKSEQKGTELYLSEQKSIVFSLFLSLQEKN